MGADVNYKDSNELTPLFVAVSKNNINTVKLLIENNADVNYVVEGNPDAYNYENTILLRAIYGLNNIDIIQTLILAGANVNQQRENTNPLSAAMQKRDLKIVKLLLKAGTDISTVPEKVKELAGFEIKTFLDNLNKQIHKRKKGM